MITFSQITHADEIISLSDYYVVSIFPKGTALSFSKDISSIGMLQVINHQIVREALVFITDSTPSLGTEANYTTHEDVAASLARLLLDSTIIAEPADLPVLKMLLEEHGFSGTIRFLPVEKLASSLFQDLKSGSIQDIAIQLHIPDPDVESEMQTVSLLNSVLRRCQISLGADLPVSDRPLDSAESDEESSREKPRKRTRKRISNRTLRRWSDALWSISPWLLIVIAALVVFFVFLLVPHGKEEKVDRNTPPINYLVLSWDKTGKYGTQSKNKNNADAPIEFRIPYGVYNILNNNSIPVEVYVVTEGQENISSSADAGGEAVELSSSQNEDTQADDAEEDTGITKITMRPNSNRQITVDTDQYVTLSEDAKELIFFYLSEVPEIQESDTTGNDYGSHAVVYAYVKGTEVRFRKSPSLEGQIIDALNNGQQVQVLGVTGEWTHVSVQDQKGYIFSQFLSSEDPSAAKNTPPSPSSTPEEAETAVATTPENTSEDTSVLETKSDADLSDTTSDSSESTDAPSA